MKQEINEAAKIKDFVVLERYLDMWEPMKFITRKEVDEKWNDLLVYEAELMKNLGDRETIHG